MAVSAGAGACGATLPQLATAPLVQTSLATEIVGSPEDIYLRIARQAQRCWFGPFGTLHGRYMMHADVPPPNSSEPVTITVHRRLANEKKPWGTSVLRLELTGQSTTSLVFANIGRDPAQQKAFREGLTRWANGQDDCGPEPPAGANPAPVQPPR